MKASRESPFTDLDFLIFNTINPKPKACTVPAKVKINENSPSLKNIYVIKIIPARIPHDIASCFFMYSIYFTCFNFYNIYNQTYTKDYLIFSLQEGFSTDERLGFHGTFLHLKAQFEHII